MAIELSGASQPKQKSSTNGNQEFKFPPKVYFFKESRMVHHPTSRYFALKEKIQAFVDAGVLILKSEQKKVIANMVTLNFETFLKMTVQDGLVPVPKDRLNVINPMAEK